MNLSRILASVVAAGIAIAATAVFLGSRRWAGETRNIRARIDAAQTNDHGVVDFSELAGLPAPVQRYFRRVLKDGQPMVERIQLSQKGEMNFSETDEKWKAFTADQLVNLQRPGFMWDARVRMMPAVDVRVHDSYASGEGALRAAVLGLITVGEFHGGTAMAEGELMRFLAESVWYPTALLPSQGVRWQSIDDHSALATLTDGETGVTLTFRFNDDGLISSFDAASRGRAIDSKIVAAPWHGRFWNYQDQGGTTVPMEGEVSWVLPTGARPYWRGQTTKIVYE